MGLKINLIIKLFIKNIKILDVRWALALVPHTLQPVLADIGGDPAAGSPTATLLRLNPPYEAQVRNGQHSTIPHPNLIRVVRRAVCARSRDVFTAR